MKREASTGKMRERVAKCSSRDSSSSLPLLRRRVKRDVRDKPLKAVKVRQSKTRKVSYKQRVWSYILTIRASKGEIKREEIDVFLSFPRTSFVLHDFMLFKRCLRD